MSISASVNQKGERGFVYLNLQHPLIAWLAYRGQIFSASALDPQAVSLNFAWYLIFKSAHRVRNFPDELALENLRQAKYLPAVSRLRGFYIFPTKKDALAAARRQGGQSFQSSTLVEVEIAPGSKASRHDMNWVSRNLGTGNQAWFGDYLAGAPESSNPIWEYIVEGRANIIDTSFRSAAIRTVEVCWPNSLDLLELSRIANQRGSDFGAIIPIVTPSGDRHQLNFCIRANELRGNCPQFWTEIAEYDGKHGTNFADPRKQFRLPDLREYSVFFDGNNFVPPLRKIFP